jgi:hypothetical protein
MRALRRMAVLSHTDLSFLLLYLLDNPSSTFYLRLTLLIKSSGRDRDPTSWEVVLNPLFLHRLFLNVAGLCGYASSGM